MKEITELYHRAAIGRESGARKVRRLNQEGQSAVSSRDAIPGCGGLGTVDGIHTQDYIGTRHDIDTRYDIATVHGKGI